MNQETNIEAIGCDHFPGVRKMFYCFIDSIESMSYPRHVNQWRVNTIALKEGRKLGQLFFIPENSKFDEAPTETPNGDIYNLSADGVILSTNELSTSLLMGIARKECLFFIEDEKGNLRIVGNAEKGVRLKVSQSSSVVTGNIFGYSFSLSFQSDGPAYWYLGSIETTEDGGVLNPNLGVLEIDFEVNDVDAGKVNSASATGVELVNEDMVQVVPLSVTPVGNKRLIVLENSDEKIGIKFMDGLHPQVTEFEDYDEGWQLNNGLLNRSHPANPEIIAELDYSDPYPFYTLKEPLSVGGNANKLRFVDVDGLQDFPSSGNKSLVTIDKLTGRMFLRSTNAIANNNFINHLTNSQSYSITVDSVVYDDWFVITTQLAKVTFSRKFAGGSFNVQDPNTSEVIFIGNSGIFATCTTDMLNTSNIHMCNIHTELISSNAKTNNNRTLYWRDCRDLISKP